MKSAGVRWFCFLKKKKAAFCNETRQKMFPWGSSTQSLHMLVHIPHNKGLHDDGSTAKRTSYPNASVELLASCAIAGQKRNWY